MKGKCNLEQGIYVDHVESKEAQCLLSQRPGLKIIQELSGWGMVEQFVKKGLGMGLLPSFMEANDPIPSIKRIDIGVKPISYEICAIYPKGMQLSRSAIAFLEGMTN